ncbi:MAG: RNA polymerase sigma factor, partial [Myxococcota bacterium]
MSPALDVPALYRRYGDLVYGRCRTLLRNEADAQDAVQEIFLKLHRYKDSFRGESSPSTWLYRI